VTVSLDALDDVHVLDEAISEVDFLTERRSPVNTASGPVPLGSVPPVGRVPQKMHAQVVRQGRYGEPRTAFAAEVVDVPPIGPDEVLIAVMAAGINYNNVWAARGYPVDH
jgi:crotonyl-CoA carboxylase/reductase